MNEVLVKSVNRKRRPPATPGVPLLQSAVSAKHRGVKWRVGFAICLLVALSAATACRGKTWTPPIRITATPWVGNAALISAREKKLFGPLDTRVIMLSSDFDGFRAILERRADMFSGTVFDMIRAIDQGADLRMVMALDFSTGADGVIARNGIKDLASLKGKKVAVERCTTTHFVLIRALEKAGMREEDVILENIATDEALLALDEGRVDAAALWDPFLSKAKKPGRQVLFTSAEIPGEVMDILGVRADLLRDRGTDIDTIVRGVHTEVDFFRNDQKRAIETVSLLNDLPSDVAEQSLRAVHFVDLAEDIALFDRNTTGASIWKTYDLATQFLKNHDMLRHPVRPAEDVIAAKPLTRVAAVHK